MDDELAKLRQADLLAVASIWGYVVDSRESCPSSVVLRSPDNKIIATNTPGGQVYCSAYDTTDSGSVIDFVQHRLPANSNTIGHVRKWLRTFSGQSSIPPPAQQRAVGKEISATSPDLPARWRDLAAATLPHPYLSQRGIPDYIQSDPRWAGRIRVDARGNLCFCHFDFGKEVCGWEVKNYDWTGFAGGGKKGIWAAGVAAADEVIITESAIDCLSHAALHLDHRCGYISVAGQVSAAQLDLLRLAVGERMAIIATDGDSAGDDLATRIGAVLPRSQRHRPEAKDWNDDLRAEAESEGVRI